MELDPDIVDVAKNWFSLASDDRMKIHICDGLDFIQNAVNKSKFIEFFRDHFHYTPSRL